MAPELPRRANGHCVAGARITVAALKLGAGGASSLSLSSAPVMFMQSAGETFLSRARAGGGWRRRAREDGVAAAGIADFSSCFLGGRWVGGIYVG